MEEHEEKLDQAKLDAKHAGKTPEQIAQIEASETAKKATREKNAKESKVRTALSSSLADAMSGVLTPDAISAIIVKSSQDANVNLPVSALNPATIGADDILDLLKSMFMLKRFDDLRSICADAPPWQTCSTGSIPSRNPSPMRVDRQPVNLAPIRNQPRIGAFFVAPSARSLAFPENPARAHQTNPALNEPDPTKS